MVIRSLAICLWFLTSSSPLLAGSPSPGELLQIWRQRQDNVENLTVDVEWQEFTEGVPTLLHKEIYHLDSLGRIKVTTNSSGPAVGKLSRVVTEMYNGEFTLLLTEDMNKDKEMKSRSDEAGVDPYRVAIINNGMGPSGRGPQMRRNPFTFLESPVISEVASVLNDGGEIEIAPTGDDPSVYEMSYQIVYAEDEPAFEHRCLLDADKGWSITYHEMTAPKTGAKGILENKLKVNDQGTWLPAAGYWKSWVEDAPDDFDDAENPPDQEWRFVVNSLALNSADFDDAVFKVEFKPGTYVNDNRYDVTYTVGSEGAIEAQIAELAQVAIDEQERARLQLMPNPGDLTTGATSSGWRTLFYGLNIAILVTIGIIVWWRKK